MLQCDIRKSCLINYLINEKNQQKKSENIQKNINNQKIVQWKCCDNNQHKKDKKTAETK